MKKVISLPLILLLILTMAVGCGQNKETIETSKDKTTANKTVENTTNNNEFKVTKNNDKNTEVFGIPQMTDDYFIKDLSDPEHAYTLEETGSKVFGMEGYLIVGREVNEGEYEEGSGFFIWARDGKALIIKGIAYLDEKYHITLEEVEKGTPQSHEMLSIVGQKPFKGHFIKYTDGTYSRNLTLLDKEVGLERVEGEFQKVDINNNKVDIIPPGATVVKTYTMIDVAPESLEGLQKGDIIEYMRGAYNDTVYAIRKAGN
jgi:predicted small lipoprotein YifL